MTSLRWPFLISATSSVGTIDLVDVVLHVERGDPVLEVGLHPVLHAGVGVHHEPVADPSRAGRRGTPRAGRRPASSTAASSSASSAGSLGGRPRRRARRPRRSLDGSLVGDGSSAAGASSAGSSAAGSRRRGRSSAASAARLDASGSARRGRDLEVVLVVGTGSVALVVLLRHVYSVLFVCSLWCWSVRRTCSSLVFESPKIAKTALPNAEVEQRHDRDHHEHEHHHHQEVRHQLLLAWARRPCAARRRPGGRT